MWPEGAGTAQMEGLVRGGAVGKGAGLRSRQGDGLNLGGGIVCRAGAGAGADDLSRLFGTAGQGGVSQGSSER